MSSSSISPKVEGGPVSITVARPSLEDGVLHVVVPPKEQQQEVFNYIIPLEGSCPDETGLFYTYASDYEDGRSLSPLTQRFEEKEGADLFSSNLSPGEVRAALWDTLSKIMASCALPDDLPRIVFHQFNEGNKSSRGRNVFDLVFQSRKAFCSVNLLKLHRISIEGFGSGPRIFKRLLFTTALPSDIFVIDCLNVRLNQTDSKALFSALASMVSSIGSLVGIAKLTAAKKGWDEDLFPAFSGTIRCYVKLDLPSLTAPLKDLVAKLPTFFLLLGAAHQLLYTGCHLHTKPVYSPDYGLIAHAGAEKTTSTAASTTSGPASAETSDAEATNASKKRKKRSE